MAHEKKSNKLRLVKVVHTQQNDDSDVSSIDSNTDSLKSEDIFAGNIKNESEDGEVNHKTSCECLHLIQINIYFLSITG